MKGFVCLSKSLFSTSLAVAIALFGLSATPALAAEEKALEEHREVFYDGLVVTSHRFPGDVLVATVAKIWPSRRAQTLGRFTLDMERSRGEWWAFGEGSEFADLRTFEYASTREGLDLSALVESHTVKSGSPALGVGGWRRPNSS